MKTTGIRDLKARLSEYLRQVAGGEVLLVTDRGRVVAEIRRPGTETGPLSPAEVRFRQAIESGLIRPSPLEPEEKREVVRRLLRTVPGPALPKGAAASLLDELREDRF